MKKLWLLLAALALIAAACGSDAEDAVDDAVDTAEDAVEDVEEAAEDAVDGDDEEAMEDEEVMEDEEDGEAMAELETLRVGYFSQWPTPNQYGQEDGSFGDAVGVPVEWFPFNSGNEMSEAMEAGEIDISYSQGLTPFANAVNNGADFKLVGVAVTYADADQCVAQEALGVNKDNAADVLEGKTVMTPIGNVTHFKFLAMMTHLGVDLDSLTIVPSEGGDVAAAAFENGDVDVACAFGGFVNQMLDTGGNFIMTGAEQESEAGIFTFDINSIPASFGEAHPEVVSNFLAAVEQFNTDWAANREEWNPVISQAAGFEDVSDVEIYLSEGGWFGFPSSSDQLGSDWLDGKVAETIKDQLDLFVELGEIPSALDDFSFAIDPSYLEAALG